MSGIKKFCICVICVTMCYVLPLILHPFDMGNLISPLHIPVLVCGLTCGPIYGALCGVFGPIVCSALSAMPSMQQLSVMLPEIAAYGVFAGIFMRSLHLKSLLLNVILALIPAILFGRITAGLILAAYYFLNVFGVESFSVSQVISVYFVDAIPTIALQLVFVPLFVVTLKEENLVKV